MKVKKRYSGVLKRLVGKLILKKMMREDGRGYYIYYVPARYISFSLILPSRTLILSAPYTYLASCYDGSYSYYKREYDRYLKILFDLGLKDRIDEIFYGQETI